ncbi:MAG: Guanosine-5'-triphosphate,3'-diphosphate pyrophosphatase, partial [Alphaproteobacteria bacterium MarineAlpha2_Bin1]
MRDFSSFSVLDIGSNSIRLVIYNKKIKSAIPIFNEKTQCGLGKNLRFSSKLSKDSCTKALKAIERYIQISESMQSELFIVATAAVRDAEDGKAFVKKINNSYNVKVNILSSKEEARFSCLGVMSSFKNPSGLIGDLGGGSLELASSRDTNFNETATLPLGILKFEGDLRRKKYLVEVIDSYLDKSRWLVNEKNRSFYAIGGAWRSLAKVFINWSNHPISVIHNYEISFKEALDLCKVLSNLSYSLKSMSFISKPRRRSVSYSSLLLERILLKVEPKKIFFSSYGIREGILYDQLGDTEKKQDSLILYCNEISKNESRFYNNILNFYKWILPLLNNFPETELRLVKAICILSDIAWKIHPSFRAEFAFKRSIYAPFVEVDHSERVYIAKTLFKRYRGNFEEINDFNILKSEQLKRASIVGTA